MGNNELKIFIAMSRTLNKLNKLNNQLFREYSLTSGQYGVLEALYHKGDRSVGEIQEMILSTTGSMPVILKNLKARELISTCTDENDRRITIVSLTDEGRDLIKLVFPKNKKIIEDYFSKISGEEQEDIVKILSKFKED
ncbi:MAG: MarR family winged helix-turn-helix transcriptional regulator [Tissierellia bacterium]|nr:MarR family winged helix-turn-helix transcriptional regulator [Tissierellia bacterium]